MIEKERIKKGQEHNQIFDLLTRRVAAIPITTILVFLILALFAYLGVLPTGIFNKILDYTKSLFG
jgi:hypothetical protein